MRNTKILIFIFITMSVLKTEAQVFEWSQFKGTGFRVTVPEGNMVLYQDSIQLDSNLILKSSYFSKFPTFNGDMELAIFIIEYPDTIKSEDKSLFWEETIAATTEKGELMYNDDYELLEYNGKMWMILKSEDFTREDYRALLLGDKLFIARVCGPNETKGEVNWKKRFFNSIIIE